MLIGSITTCQVGRKQNFIPTQYGGSLIGWVFLLIMKVGGIFTLNLVGFFALTKKEALFGFGKMGLGGGGHPERLFLFCSIRINKIGFTWIQKPQLLRL